MACRGVLIIAVVAFITTLIYKSHHSDIKPTHGNIEKNDYVISTDSVEVISNLQFANQIIDYVKKDDKIITISINGKSALIKTPTGKLGWIPLSNIKRFQIGN